jgi:hypothetical protein
MSGQGDVGYKCAQGSRLWHASELFHGWMTGEKLAGKNGADLKFGDIFSLAAAAKLKSPSAWRHP